MLRINRRSPAFAAQFTNVIDGLTKNEALAKRALVVALLLSIAPFLILTLFIHPAFDDYGFAVSFLKLGFVETQRDFYAHWTGKYFSTAIMSLGPLNFGSFAGYKAFALLLIVLTFVSVFCFVSALLETSVTVIDKLIAANFLTALFSNQMPDITEGYYWMSGTVVYQLGSILTLLFFALVFRSSGRTKGGRLFVSLLGCLLLVAIVGSSETSMLIIALPVFAVTLKMFLEKSEVRWRWLAFSIVVICCSSVVILAPGNAIRSGYFPDKHRFFFSLGMSILQEVRFLSVWLSHPSLILGTILFIPLADGFSGNTLLKNFRLHPLVFSLFLLALVFLGFFPAFWSTGAQGQHRTANAVYFLFLIGWFINLALWVNYLKEKRQLATVSLPAYVYVIGVPLLLFGLYFTNNNREAIADLTSGRAYRYDQAVEKRYLEFQQCAKTGKDCPTTPIGDLPATITNPYYETQLEWEHQYWRLKIANQESGVRIQNSE